MVQEFPSSGFTVDEDRCFKVCFMGPQAQIVAADNANVVIDQNEFGMQSRTFAGKGGVKVRVFEITDDEHIVGAHGIVGEITVEQEADRYAALRSAAQGIKKIIDGIAGMGTIIFGGIGAEGNGAGGAVEHLNACREKQIVG